MSEDHRTEGRQSGARAPLESPTPTIADHSRTALRAVIAAAPVIGGPAQVLFDAILKSPIERRRDQFLTDVAAAIEDLREKYAELQPERLAENDSFMTVMIGAAQAAVKDGRAAKREALKNAVLNAAIARSPNEDQQLMFLALLDELGEWHLRLLQFFDDPPAVAKAYGVEWSGSALDYSTGSPAQRMSEVFPELQRDFYDAIFRSLGNHGLLQVEGMHTMMTGRGTIQPRTTPWGKQFLAFVAAPD